jgi:serine/threonine protein kinase/beta-lactam-binding protein with PASTA domain
VDTTVADPLVGTVLDARYRIDGRIARGGMATVYEAHDHRLGRTVALKVLHPGYAADPSFAERFDREARAIAQLSHPNVVGVYDRGNWDGHAYLVMEYVPGRTLRDLLNERPKLSPAEATSLLESMLAALAAAHRIGMVHRDIKPENVLLGEDGSVKVADFGLARVADSGGPTATRGVLMGTVAYVAPELVMHGAGDARSDVYAAGIVLYEMLTGTLPFRGDTAWNVAYQHVHSDVPPPSQAEPGLDAPLDDLTLHATRRDPGARPPDAGALLAELRDVRADLGLPLVPAPRPHRPHHPTLAVPRGDFVPPDARGIATVASDDTPVVVPSGTARVRQDPRRVIDLDDPAPAPRPRRSRRGLFGVLAILVIALLLAGGGWYLGVGQFTTAPGVLGQPSASAQSVLDAAGLHTRFGDAVFDETVPKGAVVEQRPAPHRRIRRGATVTLVLSKGPERYAVPKVTNMPRGAAEQAIAGAHLRDQATAAYSPTVASGRVISVTPAEGSAVRRDTVLTLVISKGPAPVKLPDLRTMPVDDAKHELAHLGLKVTTTDAFDDTIPTGKVISQDPGPSTVPVGTTVALVISKGPPMITVPDERGKKFKDAKKELEQLGFKVVRGFDIPGGSSSVLNQDPPGGSQEPKGTTITLYTF